MSTQFNTTQNAPSRSNANRSPRKQPTAFPRNGKFPLWNSITKLWKRKLSRFSKKIAWLIWLMNLKS